MEEKLCRDCGVSPGQHHTENCCIARCTECGQQLLLHSCDEAKEVFDEELEEYVYEDPEWGQGQIWTGIHPGQAESEQYGLYAKWVGSEWPDPPGRWMTWDKPPEEGEDHVVGDSEFFNKWGYWDKEKQMFQIEDKWLERAMAARKIQLEEDQAKGLERWW